MSTKARRIRKRTELTLARDTIAELHARVLRSRAAGEWSTLSREADRAVREAKGNLVTARREVLRLQQPIRGQLQELRQQPFAGRDIGLQTWPRSTRPSPRSPPASSDCQRRPPAPPHL